MFLFIIISLFPLAIGTLAGSLSRQQTCPAPSIPLAVFPVGPINDTQGLGSPAFQGQAIQACPIPGVFPTTPKISSIHGGGGNTASLDRPAPLGLDVTVTSGNQTAVPFLWGKNNELTTLSVMAQNSSVSIGLAAVDPDTFEVLSDWYPPANSSSLSVTYCELNVDTNTIVIPGASGHIFSVQRSTCSNKMPYFTLQEEFDLSSQLPDSAEIFTVISDVAGNIWFCTGQFTAISGSRQVEAIIGYIDGKSRQVYQTTVTNQVVENGLSVNGKNVYLVTGPAGSAANANNATGYAWALTASDGVEVVWQSPYDAGSGFKKNGLSRGSGSTPALLGNQYMAFTDNADIQINLIIMGQGNGTEVCKVPLFGPNESANENGLVANLNSADEWGVLVENTFNWPVFNNTIILSQVTNLNSDYNDMSQMPGGLARVNVSATGVCELAWTTDIRTKAPATLSTQSGLVYIYTQDNELAKQGQYDWYVAAIDFRTGEEKWRARTGAGGAFNDEALISTLSPSGKYMQAVLGGVVAVRDS